MSEEPVVLTPSQEADELEERREKRRFKYWAAKAITITVIALLLITVTTIFYDALTNKKNIELTFVGDAFSILIDFIKYLFSN